MKQKNTVIDQSGKAFEYKNYSIVYQADEQNNQYITAKRKAGKALRRIQQVTRPDANKQTACN